LFFEKCTALVSVILKVQLTSWLRHNMRFLSCFAWLIFDPNPTLYFAIAREKFFTKIMLPMLKLDTNYGFHELFLYWPVDYVTKYDSFTVSLEWSLILIHPVVSWFIRYILYRHLQFLSHVIIIKTKVVLPQARVAYSVQDLCLFLFCFFVVVVFVVIVVCCCCNVCFFCFAPNFMFECTRWRLFQKRVVNTEYI